MARKCDQCQIKMPAFRPRLRDAEGRMLCAGCHPDGLGGEGRPVGHHGSVEDGMQVEAGDRWETVKDVMFPSRLAPTVYPRTCPTCGGKKKLDYPNGTSMTCYRCRGAGELPKAANMQDEAGLKDMWDNVKKDVQTLSDDRDEDYWDAPEQPRKKTGEKNPYRYHCGDCGAWFEDMGDYNGRPVCPKCFSSDLGEIDDHGAEYEASLRTVAHDSGDGETIYHCPFCGGGQVVGRSDGTVECDFCQTAFTVQVQPMQSGQPQTFNGQPLDMPGMPGQQGDATQTKEPGASPEAADVDDEFAVIDEAQPSPVGDMTGGGAPPADPNLEIEVISSRYFLTPDGAMDGESYMKRLALQHADEPTEVLDDIRAENRRGESSRRR